METKTKSNRIPRRIYRNEISKYFPSHNSHLLKDMGTWGSSTKQISRIEAKNGKHYEATYDFRGWGDANILLKRVK